MTQTGTYIGPIPHLKGERAMVALSDPYARRWYDKRARVFAQFNSMRAQKRLTRGGYQGRSMRKMLGYGWHPFRPQDWALEPALAPC